MTIIFESRQEPKLRTLVIPYDILFVANKLLVLNLIGVFALEEGTRQSTSHMNVTARSPPQCIL